MPTTTPVLLDELRAIVGAPHVLTDPATTAGHATDWTGRWCGATPAVARPGSTAEVAAVLAACHGAGMPVVPQGGNTGLVGGSVPMDGEILLSTRRLDVVGDVDRIERTLAAGAGVTVAQAQRAAREAGLDLGIDLASRESATLGGIVSTNAGGPRMIKHGSTRSRLLGVEAVLADGRVLTRWSGLTRDNIGYDLPGLLAGAEGTLAVLTRVLLRLVTPTTETQTVLAGVDSVAGCLALVDAARRSGLCIEAAELMTAEGIGLVRTHRGLRAPLAAPSPFHLLLELSGPADLPEAVTSLLAGSSGVLDDAVVEAGPARRLWEYRESHPEVLNTASSTPPVKLDVALPSRALPDFLAVLPADLSARFPAVRAVCFGHIADGNVHVNLLDVPAPCREAVTERVLTLVAAHGGSISAEHGIGRAKGPWIGLGRDLPDRQVMHAVRNALDPARLLNPNVLRFL
ncbi:FAD-binding oxidoreductase [Gordonia sp. (in: high G+C Gram-positive bacteria)]|uniref:FAD-binding oxidoreductase n=1 Tax=Gordonia sp. (in: high G+C Gram-positive bacteria) TaxID=84139 RepID=UPI00260DB3F5|nr:FAD-binding oxidoreductase [Gordonia sp. (in: high G+C Gram-positive bacteria)]